MMKTSKTLKKLPVEFVPGLILIGGLILANLYSYLLFHTLAELFSIIISFTIFVIFWNSRRFLRDDYFLFVAVAYFFVNVFDLAHTLTYKGMALFPDTGANLPTQLWIISRYFQALSLIVATFQAKRKIKHLWLVVGIYALLTSALLSILFIWPIFPACYVDGVGLTPFKIISEYVISALFVVSVVLLFRIHDRFDKRVFWLMVISISMNAVAEIMFTLYFNVYGLFNLIGHILRITSFYLVYKALIKIGLQEPYDVLFRNLVDNEAAFRTSEDKYRTLVENINEVIFRLDIEGRITYLSPVIETMLGYGVNEAIGAHFSESAYQDDRPLLVQEITRVMTGYPATFECRLVSDTGTLRWIRISCRPLFVGQQVAGAQGVLTDITDQRIAEEMLHIKNNAVEFALTGIAVTDLSGLISYVNPAYTTMFGYSSSHEIVGKPIGDFFNDDEATIRLNEQLRLEGHWVGDIACHRKDNTVFYVEMFASLVKDEIGKPLCYMGSFLDITERKSTERWQQLYEKLLNTLLEMSQSASVLSEKAITQRAIEEAVVITGSKVGYLHFIDEDDAELHLTTWTETTKETCKSEPYQHYSLGKAGVWADCIRLRQAVIHNNYPELENKKGYPEGHIEIHRHMSVPIFDDGKILMVLGVGNKPTDYEDSDILQLQLIGDQVNKIIQRKKAEEGLKNSLREKVVLLQEIHHRVKNNLQVVSSLLDMQAMKVKEPRILEVLQDSRNRVRAMAFVHDRLYRSQDLAVIDAADYIPSLVNYLFGVYAKTSSDIQLDFNIEDVALNLDVAVPCGLIINELVTNALKYAFPSAGGTMVAQEKKEIRVFVGSQERGHFTIIIGDNGVGLPENVDIGHTPSLGLQLVGLLTLQIGGKIELDRTHGTAYKITVPL